MAQVGRSGENMSFNHPDFVDRHKLNQPAIRLRNKISSLVAMSQDKPVPYQLQHEDLLEWMQPKVEVTVGLEKDSQGIQYPAITIEGHMRHPANEKFSAVCLRFVVSFNTDGAVEESGSYGHIDSRLLPPSISSPEASLNPLSEGEALVWERFEKAESDLKGLERTFPITPDDLSMLNALIEDSHPFS